jgi:hypothetical protein
MEFNIDVDPETGWGRVTITGELALEDFLRLMEAAWTDPAYGKAPVAIWNFHGIQTSMRLDSLMELTDWISAQKRGRGATAIAMVASEDLAFGIGRMFQAVQHKLGLDLGVFRNEHDAARWLKTFHGR